MKSDLDRLMGERNLEALVVVGDEVYSAPRDYLTNGADLTGGLVIKKRDGATVLVVNGMEIEEARASGLPVYTYSDLNYDALLKEAEGDRSKAVTGLWQQALEMFEIPAGQDRHLRHEQRERVYRTGQGTEPAWWL